MKTDFHCKLQELNLGNSEGFTDHGCGPTTENQTDIMDFTTTSLLSPKGDSTPRYSLLPSNPPFLCPIRKNPNQNKGRWDGKAFEVFCLASVFGNQRYGGVEACKASKTTAYKPCEDYSVEVCSQSDDECEQCRGDPK
jgi:hypothetical protein